MKLPEREGVLEKGEGVQQAGAWKA